MCIVCANQLVCINSDWDGPVALVRAALTDQKTIVKHQAKFLCVDYGYENHADFVGEINLLEWGYRLLDCGEWVRAGRSKKQAPTGATRKSSRGAAGIFVL